MSIDLALLPMDDQDDRIQTSFHILSCQTNCRGLYEDLEKIALKYTKENAINFITGENNYNKVSNNFACYLAKINNGEATGFSTTTKDSYNKPLRWLPVEVLMQFKNHVSVQGNLKNKAAWAYLSVLPLNTRVVLFWS